jgi:predicted Rossmann fold nucleotide-binding protein DprA/Smf involved in DNA uptake
MVNLPQSDPDYPTALTQYLGEQAPARVAALGNRDILNLRRVALFCSVTCPGRLILRAHDLAKRLHAPDVAVIGAFHTPVERECLRVLLRNAQPLIVCPARNINGMRVPAAFRQPLTAGRLLLLAPDSLGRRITADQSLIRNRVVAALADAVIVIHAEPQSKTEELCRQAVAWGKPLYTLSDDTNSRLAALGAEAITLDTVPELIARISRR